MTTHYDCIIVGGRPAGSTLAARLGKQGLRTLLLERAVFPSLPAASSPIIYSPALKLLDEIGADEAAYARGTPRIRRMVGQNRAFQLMIPIPEAHGRDYAYAIDRSRFDAALFDHAAHFPTMEARQGFHVTDLLWQGERVTGVVGHAGKDGAEERLTADLVVGADGRFSLVARKVGAEERDVHLEHPTSLLYAYWQGVRPYDEHGPAAVAYEGGPGYGMLVMDSADGTAAVTMEGQAEIIDPPPGQLEAFYLEKLQTNPALWARLGGAERVTRVQGMRRIGNLYRQPGGVGWALTGDAYHQHDPLDGQGIFNALFTAKSLAWAIRYWKRGQMSWDEALAWYDETSRIKTYGMYRRTLGSVRDNLYTPGPQQMPGWAVTGLRWVMEDPRTQDLLGKLLTRQLPPEVIQAATPAVAVGALMRGPLRELGRDLRRRLGV